MKIGFFCCLIRRCFMVVRCHLYRYSQGVQCSKKGPSYLLCKNKYIGKKSSSHVAGLGICKVFRLALEEAETTLLRTRKKWSQKRKKKQSEWSSRQNVCRHFQGFMYVGSYNSKGEVKYCKWQNNKTRSVGLTNISTGRNSIIGKSASTESHTGHWHYLM